MGIEYLTILNCNRQPLEQTLGVDLIYYSHRFDSFVLVQYKRMSEGTQGAEYRPGNDPSHEKELERMLKTEEFLKAQPKGKNTSTSVLRFWPSILYETMRAKGQGGSRRRNGIGHVRAA